MIDLEKVIKEFADYVHYFKPYCIGDIEDHATLKDVLELLKEQDEKKGQWIPIESPTGVEAFGVKEMTVMNVRCSVCGSEEDVSFTGYKYCPRCGAKMEGR